MCRNIKTLHNFEPPATEDEIQAAALQYVRKVSGSQKPSQANEAAFGRAIEEVGLGALAVRHRHGEPPSLRWILAHLVGEYARHCGHADLIRESVDGTVDL